MKINFPIKTNGPGTQLHVVSLAALLLTFFFPASNLYAGTLDECLMEALKKADSSVTVGQLYEQCKPETGTKAMTKPTRDSAAVDNGNSPMSSNGPAEMILKTSRARKPAYFPHQKHQDKYACDLCHHGMDSSGKLVKYTAETAIYTCISCHNPDMPNAELNGFQAIGHQLCRECHRKNQDITSATCSTCHRKNLQN